MKQNTAIIFQLILLTSIQLATSQLNLGARDLGIGRRVPNITCELYRETAPQQWELISQGVTGSSGGLTDLITENEFILGNYRIVLYTKPYWDSRNLTSFYPSAEIQFEHNVIGSNYVIPMLISPYGYAVYKGSIS